MDSNEQMKKTRKAEADRVAAERKRNEEAPFLAEFAARAVVKLAVALADKGRIAPATLSLLQKASIDVRGARQIDSLLDLEKALTKESPLRREQKKQDPVSR